MTDETVEVRPVPADQKGKITRESAQKIVEENLKRRASEMKNKKRKIQEKMWELNY